MTTEDYVSFETAKLLKEKGFDEASVMYYPKDGGEMTELDLYDLNYNRSKYIKCPTQAMAMKWLRERGWFIHIDIIREASAWLVDVQDIKNDVAIYPVGKECSSYEEAAEVAIKYCLENLI